METQSTLIFACSGAADVGEISDRVARQISAKGTAKMFCLAGIGGKVDPIMNKTMTADKIIAIDGCGLDCTKKCLENARIMEFQHVRITDMGLEKGSSPATAENVSTAVDKLSQMLD